MVLDGKTADRRFARRWIRPSTTERHHLYSYLGETNGPNLSQRWGGGVQPVTLINGAVEPFTLINWVVQPATLINEFVQPVSLVNGGVVRTDGGAVVGSLFVAEMLHIVYRQVFWVP